MATKANMGEGKFFNSEELRAKAKKHAKKFYTEYNGNIDAVISDVKEFQHIKDNLEDDITEKMKLEMKIFDAAACVDIAQFSEDDKKKFIAETGVDLSKSFPNERAEGGKVDDDDNYTEYVGKKDGKYTLLSDKLGQDWDEGFDTEEELYAHHGTDTSKLKPVSAADKKRAKAKGIELLHIYQPFLEDGGKINEGDIDYLGSVTPGENKSLIVKYPLAHDSLHKSPDGKYSGDSDSLDGLYELLRFNDVINADALRPDKGVLKDKWVEYLLSGKDIYFLTPRNIADLKSKGETTLKYEGDIDEFHNVNVPEHVEFMKMVSEREKMEAGGNVGKKCKTGLHIATLLFDKEHFTKAKVKSWLKRNEFKYGNIEEEKNHYRASQEPSGNFTEDSFRTTNLKGRLPKGIQATTACPAKKEEGGELYGAIKELAEPNTLIDTTATVEMAAGGAVAEDASENIRIATMHCLESGLANAVKRSGDIEVEMKTDSDKFLRLDFYIYEAGVLGEKKHKYATYNDDEIVKESYFKGYETGKYKSLIDQTEEVLTKMGIHIANKFEIGGDVFSDEIIFTTDDNIAAHKDGWAISYAGTKDGVPHYELIKVGDKFLSFAGVVKHVIEKAKEGSKLHEKALAFIKAKDPVEWNLIVEISDKDKEFLDSLSAEKFACGGKMAEGGKLRKSILDEEDTDLLGEPKKYWMYTSLFQKYPSETISGWTKGQVEDHAQMMIANIKKAVNFREHPEDLTPMQKALEEGRLTVKDAIKICDAAELSTPPSILKFKKTKSPAKKIVEEKAYTLGDMWSSDFDYDGMLKKGVELGSKTELIDHPNINAVLGRLESLFDSFEYVNYHTEGKPLWDAIKLLRDAHSGKANANQKEFLLSEAKTKLKEFVAGCKAALVEIDALEAGGKVRGKGVYGKDWVWEFGVPRKLKRGEIMSKTASGAPIIINPKKDAERKELIKRMGYHESGGKVKDAEGGSVSVEIDENAIPISVSTALSNLNKKLVYVPLIFTKENDGRFLLQRSDGHISLHVRKLEEGMDERLVFDYLDSLSKKKGDEFETGGTVNWFGGESFGKDPRLESFNKFDLDDYQYMVYSDMVEKGRTHGEALQLLINQVEGDYSQLGKLAKIAKAQYKEAKAAAKVEQKEKHADVGEAKTYKDQYGGYVKGYISTWNHGAGKYAGLPLVYGIQETDMPGSKSWMIVGGILVDGELVNTSEAYDDWFGDEQVALDAAKEIATNEHAFTDQYAAGGKLGVDDYNIGDEVLYTRKYDYTEGYERRNAWVAKKNGKKGISYSVNGAGGFETKFIVPDWKTQVKPWGKVSEAERNNLTSGYAEGGKVESPDTYDYMLLNRLQSDCDYFLGWGNRSEKHLWAGNVHDQIEKMKSLWNSLTKKPEWLSMEDILDYERKMKGGDVSVYGTDAEVEKMYLDYVNNFLTVDAFAEHYNISKEKADRIIELGREINGRLENGGAVAATWADRTTEVKKYVGPSHIVNKWEYVITWDNYAHRSEELYTSKAKAEAGLAERITYLEGLHNMPKGEFAAQFKTNVPKELLDEFVNRRDPKFSNYDNEKYSNFSVDDFKSLVWDQSNANGSIVPGDKLLNFIFPRNFNINSLKNGSGGCNHNEEFMKWESINAALYDIWIEIIGSKNIKEDGGDISSNGGGSSSFDKTDFTNVVRDNYSKTDQWHPGDFEHRGNTIFAAGGKAASFSSTDDLVDVVDILDEWERYCKRKGEDDDDFDEFNAWIDIKYPHPGGKIKNKAVKEFTRTHKEPVYADGGAVGSPKFKRGDYVGWKSDSDFTKGNKDLPPMRVNRAFYSKEDRGWMYVLGNVMGSHAEYELEAREAPKLAEGGVASADWERLFANPQRFMRYDGQFLYPPRIEHKLQPASLDKLDTGEYIAEPKFNGSSTSVSISENNAVAKERHNTFFAIPPKFDFKSLHRGEGYMCLTGEFMNKSKKDHTGQPFRGFVIWDILAYDGLMLIGSTPTERVALLEELYPSMGAISVDGIDYAYKTGVPDIYRGATFAGNFYELYSILKNVDMIEGLCLKRNSKLEVGSRELNNVNIGCKVRKPTANYIS